MTGPCPRLPHSPLLARLLASSALVALSLLAAPHAMAQALPTGASVAAGSATVKSGANGVTVTQGSSRTVINWNSFNIAAGKSVTFAQPDAGSAILNRVQGTGITSIAGNLGANGQVFLVNRNGIIITPTGTVNTAGFVGSTLDITNADFLAGRYNFAGAGAGSVTNQGSIVSAPGSYVALLGSSVSNEGLITAPLGVVSLGSGQSATLDLSGNGVLQVAIPTDLLGDANQALVSNSGTIAATGGTVVMKAAAAREAVRRTINMSGVITANGISGHDGAVVLGTVVIDGGDGGDAVVSGTIDVSGPANGGRIDLTAGHSVSLTGATLNATGGDTGGLIRIGGAFQGGVAQPNVTATQLQQFVGRFGDLAAVNTADTTLVDAASSIDVSGGKTGGTAVVWSNLLTTQAGLIKATGAVTGGSVETSSHTTLQSDVTRVSVGPGGTLLLDPANITVDTAANLAIQGNTPSTYAGAVGYDATSTTSYFTSESVQTLLQAGTDVVLKASQDINFSNVNMGIYTGHSGGIYLSAGRSVNISGVNIGTANLTVVANDTTANGVNLVNRDQNSDGTPGGGVFAGDVQTFNGGELDGGAGSAGSGGNISLTLGAGEKAGNLRLGSIVTSGTGNITLNAGAGKLQFFPQTPFAAVNVTAAGTIVMTGPISPQISADTDPTDGIPIKGLTFSAHSVTWTDEATSKLIPYSSASPVEFIENGVITRYGTTLQSTADFTRVSLGVGGAQTGIAYGATPTYVTAHLTSGALHGTDTIATVEGGLTATVTGPPANSPAGTYNVTISATTNLASMPMGYFYNLTSVTDTIHIGLKVLTPTISNGSYVYGSPTAVVSLAGITGGDVVAPVVSLNGVSNTLSLVSGSNFAFAATTAAGTRNFTLTGLSGTNASSYSLDLSGIITASLSISQKPLSYGFLNATSTYGTLASPGVYIVNGIVGSDDVAPGSITATSGGVSGALSATTSVGTYVLTLASLSGNTAGNYSIASTGNTPGSLAISPKPLTYVATNANSTYGTLATVTAPTLSGIVSGDTVTSSTLLNGSVMTLTATTNAGTYAITPSLGGASASNYVVASTGNTTGALTIAQKQLSFTVTPIVVQTYGSQTTAVTLSGILAGDTVVPAVSYQGSFTFLQSTGAGAYAFDVRSPAQSSQTFTLNSLGGASAGNYSLNLSVGNITGALAVSTKTVTYSIDNSSQLLNATVAPPVITFNGELAGDTLTAPLVATNQATSTVVTFDNTAMAVGAYTLSIAPGTLGGASAANYALSLTGNTDGSRTVNSRTVTYNVGNPSSTYGNLASLPTATISGQLNGADVTGVITVEVGGSPYTLAAKSPVGTYSLVVTSLGGVNGSDYTIAPSGNVNGTLTINPKPITFSIASTNSTYGTLAVPVITFAGVLSGDTVSGTAGYLDVGLQPGTPIQTLNARTQVGAYTLDLGSLSGTDSANYTLAGSGNSRGTVQISAKTLTYQYGNATAVFGQFFSLGTVTLTGVASGDTVLTSTALLDANSNPVNTGGFAQAATYSEVVTGIYGGSSPNYVLASAGNTPGVYTITPKPISAGVFLSVGTSNAYGTLTTGSNFATVQLPTVTGFTNVAGTLLPPSFTGSVSDAGFLKVGTYSLSAVVGTVGNPQFGLTGSDAHNYTVTGANSVSFQITPVTLSSTLLTNLSSTYGTLATLALPSLSGVKSGDVVTAGGSAVTTQGGSPITLTAQTPVGAYNVTVTGLSGADSANYTIGSGTGTLTINPKPITATAVNSTSVYGTLASLNAPILTGLVGLDSVQGVYSSNLSFNSSGYTYNTPILSNTAAGAYTIKVSGITGPQVANYTLSNAGSTATLTIQQKPLTYTLVNPNQTVLYGTQVASPVQLVGVVAGDVVSAPVFAKLVSAAAGNGAPVGAIYTVDGTEYLNASVYNFVFSSYIGSVALSGYSSSNYILAGNATTSLGTVVVNPRPLTYSLTNANVVYGTAPGTALTLNGALSGAPLSYTLTATNAGGTVLDLGQSATVINTPVGNYTVKFALTGNSSFNYSTGGSSNGALQISAKPITASLDTTVATYGTAVADLWSLSGVLAGDSVFPVINVGGQTVTLIATSPGYGLSSVPWNAGVQNYSLQSITGAQASNYTLTNAGQTTGLTILPKPITYAIAPFAAQYGGFTIPSCSTGGVCELNSQDNNLNTGAVTFFGVLPQDQGGITGNVGLTNGYQGFTYGRQTPAGTYLQILTGIQGFVAGNYTLAGSGNTAGVATIIPAWVEPVISSGGRIYNGTLTGGYEAVGTPGVVTFVRSLQTGTFNAPITGPVFNDDLQATVGIFYSNGAPYTAGEPIPVGNYLLEALALTGQSAANYQMIRVDNPGAGFSGYQPGGLIVSDASVFNFGLLGNNPNTPYTPPAAVTTPVSHVTTQTTTTTSASSTASGPSYTAQAGAGVGSSVTASSGAVSTTAGVTASTGAIASFSPVGVYANANANSGASLSLTVGPATINEGVGGNAGSTFVIDPLSLTPSIQLDGIAKVDVGEGVTVSGALGSGVSGATGFQGQVFAEARSNNDLTYENGALNLGTSEFVGVGASTGISGGLSGGGVSGSATVTVFSPGSLYIGARSVSSTTDGTLTLSFTIGVAIGIGGLQIQPTIAFPTAPIVNFASDVGGIVSFVVGGGKDTPTCNAACQTTAAAAANVKNAQTLASNGPSLQLMSLLSSSPATLATLQGNTDLASRQAVADYQNYGGLPNQLNAVMAQEQGIAQRVAANPNNISLSDLQAATDLRRQETYLIGEANILGAKISVSNGTVSLVAK